MTKPSYVKPLGWADEHREITNVCLYGTVWETPVEAGGKLGQTPPAGSKVNTRLMTPLFRECELKALAAGETPRIIHCDQASNMFAPTVKPEHVRQIFDAMRGASHHSYVLPVEADPQLLLAYADYVPRNVWLGMQSPSLYYHGFPRTRTELNRMLDETLTLLAEVKARAGNVVWLDVEALSWDLASALGRGHPLDWVVVGAESGWRGFIQPDPADMGNLLNVMAASRTPVFCKSGLSLLLSQRHLHGGWPTCSRSAIPTHYRDGSEIPAVAERLRSRAGTTQAPGGRPAV